jgi:aerobic carbon-monoxide dehydrogenase medium subunit
MLAVDAQFTLQGKNGQRTLAADDFFIGQLTTVLRPDEMLVRVEIPTAIELTGSSIQEVAIRAGDFALAGVATSLTLGPDGRVSRARIVCFGVANRPVRIHDAESALEGRAPTEDALTTAGEIVSAQVETVEDIHASAAYHERVSGVLARRALAAALSALPQVSPA